MPLYYAAAQNYEEGVRLLLDYGANPMRSNLVICKRGRGHCFLFLHADDAGPLGFLPAPTVSPVQRDDGFN